MPVSRELFRAIFQNLRWEPTGEAGGAPILRGFSLAYAACRVAEVQDGGDHMMFVGSVEAGVERPAPPVEGTA